MTATEDHICEIAMSIWETMFTTPLHRAAPRAPIPGPVMTGCVTIEGAWEGAVMLSCPDRLAHRLAAELFGPGVETAEVDVRDAIGEVTNMLAGNLKAQLPHPSRISLPTVANGVHRGLSVVGTTQTAAVHFRCGDDVLEVSVHEAPRKGDA